MFHIHHTHTACTLATISFLYKSMTQSYISGGSDSRQSDMQDLNEDFLHFMQISYDAVKQIIQIIRSREGWKMREREEEKNIMPKQIHLIVFVKNKNTLVIYLTFSFFKTKRLHYHFLTCLHKSLPSCRVKDIQLLREKKTGTIV